MTYIAPAPSRPPTSEPAPGPPGAALGSSTPSPPPQVAPQPAPPVRTAPLPVEDTRPPTPPPPTPPSAPAPTPDSGGEGFSNVLIAAIVIVVLLIGGGIAALVLSGREDKAPAAKTAAKEEPEKTAEPTAEATPALKGQVETLDSLDEALRARPGGRAEGRLRGGGGEPLRPAAPGPAPRAPGRRRRAEGRRDELRRRGPRIAATEPRVREPAARPSDLQKVTKLKQDALEKINPLLEAQDLDTYKATEI